VKRAVDTSKRGVVYFIYRSLDDAEVGDTHFTENLLWFNGLEDARAAATESAQSANQACLDSIRLILNEDSPLVMNSGYSWVVMLFRFVRRRGEDLDAASSRILANLAVDDEIEQRLKKALVAVRGKRFSANGDKNPPTITKIDVDDELWSLADQIVG
jgi:hypothetical protein